MLSPLSAYFSALTYYEHMLIIQETERDYAETEMLQTCRRPTGQDLFQAAGDDRFIP
jgi:hypothetical protein